MGSFPTDSSFYSTLRVFPDFVQDLARDGAPSATALYRCANMIPVEKNPSKYYSTIMYSQPEKKGKSKFKRISNKCLTTISSR